MQLSFLTNEFYKNFQHLLEIEKKPFRPYIVFLVCYKEIDFAIPFRTHIKHLHCYKILENKEENNVSGIDYSKSVIITDKKYLSSKKPKIREAEF